MTLPAAVPGASLVGVPGRIDGISVDFDVPSRMRDGVLLHANVYRPAGAGPWPTLLTRTPYGKDDIDGIRVTGLDPTQAARRGFLVVVQDTRGRFASEGEWDPFVHERDDGYDTIEWAARLPGSNGRVGMFGSSYCGNSQWLPAIAQPPSLRAISPSVTWSEPLDGLFARGGAVELGLTLPWTLQTGADHLVRIVPEDELDQRMGALVAEYDRLDEDGYWHLPVGDGGVLARHGAPDLGGLRALADAEHAARCRVVGAHDRVQVPSLHTASWYDVFLQGSLDNYEAMVASGREARLVVGPWTHGTYEEPIGEARFGLWSHRDGVPAHPEGDWNDVQLAFLRRHLVSEEPEPVTSAPVRIFVMGANVWRDEPAWPLERAIDERWHLHGSGSLAPERPGPGDRPSTFVYDPGDPVATIGGPTLMTPGLPGGPRDQRPIERRDDVLVFTSEPIEAELEVTGRVRVVLHAESSAPSTDWVARLCDVHPDGRSLDVCDGILRVAEGADRCARLEIDLWSTSIVFLRGHRLRVHVTSSCFPRWDRNLNTGRQDEARYERARQRVFHDAERASYVVLPVVREGPGEDPAR